MGCKDQTKRILSFVQDATKQKNMVHDYLNLCINPLSNESKFKFIYLQYLHIYIQKFFTLYFLDIDDFGDSDGNGASPIGEDSLVQRQVSANKYS